MCRGVSYGAPDRHTNRREYDVENLSYDLQHHLSQSVKLALQKLQHITSDYDSR
jgi:hypothetical protein